MTVNGSRVSVGVVVAAAGSGTRLGRGSKALVRLNGRTTLARAVQLFLGLDEVSRIVVVGRAGGGGAAPDQACDGARRR